ncbi:tetratricopeptide repeat protein [Bradyrhizobium sp. LjRoot220]|uniref:tetratricopeptide repeat protein n=1 Tax=Bradyrhizobium sp. LjRoot220 TaxID=3342284 RepID=UPI003ECC2416
MHRLLPIVLGLIMLVGIDAASAAADDRATCLAVNSGANDAKAVDACTGAIESGKFRATELARLYNCRGLALTNLGQYARAIPDFTRALQITGKQHVLFNNRGLAYKAKGEYDLAIADYSEALRLNPKYEDSLQNRGRAYYDKSDYARAIADYGEAIRLYPKKPDFYGGRGTAYFKNGDQDRALADFNEMIRLGSKITSTYYNRGVVYEAKEDFAKALGDFRTALAMDPQSKQAVDAILRIEKKSTAGSAANPVGPPSASATLPPPGPTPVARPATQVAALPLVSPPLAAAKTTNDVGRRVALVIGNNRYANLAADRQLVNAINDARAVKTTLEGLRFEVLYGENLDRRSLVDKLFELAARLGKDDIAFFYYAGHGVSLSGANYLLPSDIPNPHATGRAEEARLADQAIAETQVIERIIGSGARVTIVVLDACRDNPLRGSDTRAIGGSRGLALGQPAQGVFSIYSAGFGQGALDRLGPDDRSPNSVFTRVFIEKLKTPGLDLKAVATETRRTVVELAQKVGQNQFPAYYDQISSEVYLAGQPAR